MAYKKIELSVASSWPIFRRNETLADAPELSNLKGETMTRTLAEILLFVSIAVNAALLIFIAGVLRKIMNDMDEPAFKQFVVSLVRHSKKSPFMLTVLNIPFIGAIPYCYFYGFGNRWLIGGLALWLVAGGIAKAIKVPVYKSVAAIEEGNAKLRIERRKLNAGNMLQAILNSIAAVLAAVSFR